MLTFLFVKVFLNQIKVISSSIQSKTLIKESGCSSILSLNQDEADEPTILFQYFPNSWLSN